MVYTASPIKRRRATRDEMEERAEFLIGYARKHGPVTVRQLFYAATVAGIVGIDKTEAGYNKVQVQVLDLRRAGRLGTTNKKALKLSQQFAAAEAWISTLKGAAKALEQGTFGFAQAAAIIAKGAAFVSAIKGTSEGNTGNAGGSGAAATPPPLPVQRVDIALTGGSLETRNTAEAIIAQLNEAAARGYRVDARLVS